MGYFTQLLNLFQLQKSEKVDTYLGPYVMTHVEDDIGKFFEFRLYNGKYYTSFARLGDRIKQYIKTNKFYNGKKITLPDEDPLQKIMKFTDAATFDNLFMFMNKFMDLDDVLVDDSKKCHTCKRVGVKLKLGKFFYCGNECLNHI